jgi:uncharacterized protein (DUF58 family)
MPVDADRTANEPSIMHTSVERYSGIVPSLDELVGLRRAVLGRRPPRRGRYGLSGQAPAPMRGRGMEYAESREYAQGDDARHIDWRLTARTGRPHTKVFQAERERLTLIVADTAPQLYFGTRTRFKSVQAARAGAIAAWAAVRDGDRIAALRGSGREAPIAPAAGPRGALRVLDALVRWYATPPEHDDGLGVALDHADRLLRPGARLVVLADPLSVVAQPPSRWPTLVQHREVVVLLLCDPLERDPPRTALPFWIDRAAASAPHRVELDLAAGAQRERWQAAFSAPMDEAQSILKRSGIRGFALSTDAPSESWLDLFAGTRAA